MSAVYPHVLSLIPNAIHTLRVFVCVCVSSHKYTSRTRKKKATLHISVVAVVAKVYIYTSKR
jgi:hypothetical protein